MRAGWSRCDGFAMRCGDLLAPFGSRGCVRYFAKFWNPTEI